MRDWVLKEVEFSNTDNPALRDILQELTELHAAVVAVGLPPVLQRPFKMRGRPGWNRFLLIALLIYALKRGWSYRQLERFCKEHLEILRIFDRRMKKGPDHSSLYAIAKELSASYIFRVHAKLRELRGEIPILPY